MSANSPPGVAFVLGGGGNLGGYEAGMLRALFEAGIAPQLIVGTSIGSLQGAVAAADPSLSAAARLSGLWTDFVTRRVMKVSVGQALSAAIHERNHIGSADALRELLVSYLGADTRIEDLTVPFQCVAACIERAAARYFDSGPLVEAVMASCAVPGFWPPVEIDGEHYFDGGLVDSIPVRRALELGASVIYVLHVGRIERPLTVPRRPWDVASVSFEIARRHGFADAIANVPERVELHVLPSGADGPHRELFLTEDKELEVVKRRIERGYLAARDYLAQQAVSAS